MSDLIVRLGWHLADRSQGPEDLRLIVQPFASVLLAIMDGVQDAEDRRPPYLWSRLTPTGHSRAHRRAGWLSLCKILLIALALDAAYQEATLRVIYVGDAIVVALLLAILPYVVIRGLVTRLVGGGRARVDRPPKGREKPGAMA